MKVFIVSLLVMVGLSQMLAGNPFYSHRGEGYIKRPDKEKLDYHQLKDLRESMIKKNARHSNLYGFYSRAAKKYKVWEQPKPIHVQRRPKEGDEIWFFNEDEKWWQTGVAKNISKEQVEPGMWTAMVSPTQWPQNAGYAKTAMKILSPDKKRIDWQSQKACDMGTHQKEANDRVMEKRLYNLAKEINKDNMYPYIGLTRWLIVRKQWESAYETCQQALAKDKRWFLPYMYMGIIKRKMGQADEAKSQDHYKTSLRHFKEAMELNPANVEAVNNLAHFYYYIDKNHRKSCFWHRVLNELGDAAKRRVKHLGEHIEECDRVQPRFDHEEL